MDFLPGKVTNALNTTKENDFESIQTFNLSPCLTEKIHCEVNSSSSLWANTFAQFSSHSINC